MQVNPKNIVVTLPRAVFSNTPLFKRRINTFLNWKDDVRWKEVIQADNIRLFKFVFDCFHLIMFFPMSKFLIFPLVSNGLAVDFPSLTFPLSSDFTAT